MKSLGPTEHPRSRRLLSSPSARNQFAGFGHVESWASWSILASIFFPLGVAFVVYGSSYVVSGLNKRSVTQRVLALQETTKGFMVRESSRDDSD